MREVHPFTRGGISYRTPGLHHAKHTQDGPLTCKFSDFPFSWCCVGGKDNRTRPPGRRHCGCASTAAGLGTEVRAIGTDQKSFCLVFQHTCTAQEVADGVILPFCRACSSGALGSDTCAIQTALVGPACRLPLNAEAGLFSVCRPLALPRTQRA